MSPPPLPPVITTTIAITITVSAIVFTVSWAMRIARSENLVFARVDDPNDPDYPDYPDYAAGAQQ